MDTKLVDRQALETGICPVREDLYTQAFGKKLNDRQHVVVLIYATMYITN